ncbi:hypothetical protein AB1Y20_010881 [Prymnesium parvum]|uniref:Uncharacterized protein n=1 Tax=Prymnesium parvum TaxID=97485 RepID=A0AB34ISR2_PRYPA
MPPRSAPKLPGHVLFSGVAGDHRKLDLAFRRSLVEEGPLSVDSAHWILTVLPFLTPAAVTLRLLVFVFLPAFVLDPGLDQADGCLLFYPSLLSVSRLLHRLVKEGMSSEPLPDVRSLRARVIDAASRLPAASRLLSRSSVVVVVAAPPPCVLARFCRSCSEGPTSTTVFSRPSWPHCQDILLASLAVSCREEITTELDICGTQTTKHRRTGSGGKLPLKMARKRPLRHCAKRGHAKASSSLMKGTPWWRNKR